MVGLTKVKCDILTIPHLVASCIPGWCKSWNHGENLAACPPGPPQPQKRQPGDQKSTVQKWHPPGKPCSLPLLRHCSDPWQIIWECHGCPWLPSSYGDPQLRQKRRRKIGSPWFPAAQVAWVLDHAGTVKQWLYLPGAGYWALTWRKEINSRYSRQRIIARIPAMLATSTKYTNKILRLQSYPPKESNNLVSGFNLQHITYNTNPPKFPMSKTCVVRQDPGPVECQ